ncbi:hypothetical protein J4P02_28020 [Pseudomonas sp. NFXW11]|uniref:hypothetical protein n=1 Tax=Pseudomonas sp. NFXW11 TaxID=2819531 RepID=UPI003CEDBBCE
MSLKAHIWPMTSLPPAFSIKVSWPHSAGTMTSSAPASMKPAPEPSFQDAQGGGLFAGDHSSATEHGHLYFLWFFTGNKKGALWGALVFFIEGQ